MGHDRLYEVMAAREAIYAKADFSEEDGVRSAELEAEFAEMNGYEAESEAAVLLNGLGIPEELRQKQMKELEGGDKVRVLLAQALFGNPDVLLLDEPTNHLDLKSIAWLEDFLFRFTNTVIVVSHDRHFLNQVCTHVADIDFGLIKVYVGNYDFWYQASQLNLKQKQDENRKVTDKANELKEFIQRFSSNASKAQAGHLPQETAGEADHRGDAGLVTQIPVCRLQAGARLRRYHSGNHGTFPRRSTG